MQPEFDYRGSWHRDSYAAWGKDSEREVAIREIHSWPCTQVLLAIEDDACFWLVPGSHNRPNTAEEERKFEEGETSWEEMFPGAVQVKLKAGTAVPFDSRAIHRGLKRPGTSRRSIFFVYGPSNEVRHSGITAWAKDPVYQDAEYLASLPDTLRAAIEITLACVE
jgi:ectoine hydroxylase-related dioxygenase (phytanoyl-CoA dioxygenase family)